MEYVIGGMRVDWYSSGRQGQKVEEKKMGRECIIAMPVSSRSSNTGGRRVGLRRNWA